MVACIPALFSTLLIGAPDPEPASSSTPIANHLSRSSYNQKMPARDGDDVYIISALTAIVALAAGYVATDKGQRALDDITAARYLAPLDVFIFSILAAILSSIASRRFQALDDFPAIFIMIAASATADILLQCRSLGWIVYVPCGILVMFLVYKVSRLLFSWVSTAILPLLREFFIYGIGMLKRMVQRGRVQKLCDDHCEKPA